MLLILLLNIVVTAFSYLFVPVCLWFFEAKMRKQTIKKVVIINGAVIWLIIKAIQLSQGIESNTMAVFLWSSIAYWLLSKKCLADSNDHFRQEYYSTLVNNTVPNYSPATEEALSNSYNEGYNQGYSYGYNQGYADASFSIKEEIEAAQREDTNDTYNSYYDQGYDADWQDCSNAAGDTEYYGNRCTE